MLDWVVGLAGGWWAFFVPTATGGGMSQTWRGEGWGQGGDLGEVDRTFVIAGQR